MAPFGLLAPLVALTPPRGFFAAGLRLRESVRAGGRGGFLALRREMLRDSERSLYRLPESSSLAISRHSYMLCLVARPAAAPCPLPWLRERRPESRCMEV